MMRRLVLAVLFALAAGPALAQVSPAISVVTVEEEELRERVYASGRIVPVEEIVVAPQIEGQRIEALRKDLGDWVEAGEVMAKLADETLLLQRSQIEAQGISAQAAVAQAEAQLAEARASADEALRVRDRTERLRADGAAAQAALDQAQAVATSALARVGAAEQAVAAAQAQVDLAALHLQDVDLHLARTRITAPVAGLVTARNARIGAIASAAGAPMFILIRDGALELRADLAEQDVTRLAAGQAVLIRPVGVGAELSGRVRLVDPTVDALTRLGGVRLTIDDSGAVRQGLFAEAEILVIQRRGLTLPVTAVLADQDGARVLAVDAEGLVSAVAVETGIRDGARIEILSGLAAGDRVVARAGAFVRPGDRITPVALADTLADAGAP